MSPVPADHCAPDWIRARRTTLCVPKLSRCSPRGRVRELQGGMVVKFADGLPRSLPRRSVAFEYEVDGFKSREEFLVVELNSAFDCIFGMPWLARHRPDVDWLNRTVKPRDIDADAVLAMLQESNWPHVAVVDPASAPFTHHETSDGPSCVVCYNASCAPSVEQRLPNVAASSDQWTKVRRSRRSKHAQVPTRVSGVSPSARAVVRTPAQVMSRAGRSSPPSPSGARAVARTPRRRVASHWRVSGRRCLTSWGHNVTTMFPPATARSRRHGRRRQHRRFSRRSA